MSMKSQELKRSMNIIHFQMRESTATVQESISENQKLNLELQENYFHRKNLNKQMSKLSKKTALAQVLAQKMSTSEDIVMEKAIYYKKEVGQLKLTINKV